MIRAAIDGVGLAFMSEAHAAPDLGCVALVRRYSMIGALPTFQSLANSIVPAVVLFSTFLGAAASVRANGRPGGRPRRRV